jgi:hypothetical protein
MSVVESVNGKVGEVLLIASDVEAVPQADAGAPGGVATLDTEGHVPLAQLSDEVASSGTSPSTGDGYLWNGAEWVPALLAPLASPTFTGTPTAPTPAEADNSTSLATTAFAHELVSTETTRAEAAEASLIPLSQKAAAAGVATLDGEGHVPVLQLPGSLVRGSGNHIVAASMAEVEAKAAAMLASGAVYDYAIVNATTGELEDIGGGTV